MERRELYDPEDIEQLLMERGFDELLPEERAFVLRHLDGAAEYERMRSLLLNVAEDDADTDVADADPGVRAQLLEVFREQKRPRYTIWLNSMAAFLVPERPSGYWRPALALGMVALVITVALLAPWAREAAAPSGMAEVRVKHVRDTMPVPAQVTRPETAATEEQAIAPILEAHEEQAKVDDAKVPLVAADAAAPAVSSTTAAGAAVVMEDLAEADMAPAQATEATDEEKSVALRTTDAPAMHAVKATELLSNQSLANEQGTTFTGTSTAATERTTASRKRKSSAKSDDATVLASDPTAYLGLLKAAW